MKFVPELTPLPPENEPAYWFAFSDDKLFIENNGSSCQIPFAQDLSVFNLEPVRRQYLGKIDGHPVYSAELASNSSAPSGMAFEGLRQVYERIEEGLFWVACRAVQIVRWDRTHQFCGQCGTPTKTKAGEYAKVCTKCGFMSYPRLSPAIITAVTKGDKILLARGRRFAGVMYSVLAGFVEPGETAEECLKREVREEVGIEVKNISYFGSQPWPFPNSLMLAFTAEYESGQIIVNKSELVDAGWFTADNLPPIPGKLSVARKLIDWFVNNHSKKGGHGKSAAI
jgi:NAD+ diphosphatase